MATMGVAMGAGVMMPSSSRRTRVEMGGGEGRGTVARVVRGGRGMGRLTTRAASGRDGEKPMTLEERIAAGEFTKGSSTGPFRQVADALRNVGVGKMRGTTGRMLRM